MVAMGIYRDALVALMWCGWDWSHSDLLPAAPLTAD
ncbi:Serine/threonine protein kinase [Giardia duodenalis]|uniref:Serine/threonine protein kinase n=1 Tax=Giardia intestinalis TaxID=5741 RepID=V6TW50_GIAIN|nr:Serine/threonine protein kinase [Giardia intestinalis]